MAPFRADSPVGPRPSPAGTPAARDASHLAPVVCVPPRTVGTRPPAPRCSGWLGNAPSCSGDWNSGRGHPSLPAPPAWGSRGQGQPRPIPGLLTADAQPSLGPAVTPHPKCAPETCRPHVLAWDGSHQSSSWFWSPGQGQWAGKPGGWQSAQPGLLGSSLAQFRSACYLGSPRQSPPARTPAAPGEGRLAGVPAAPIAFPAGREHSPSPLQFSQAARSECQSVGSPHATQSHPALGESAPGCTARGPGGGRLGCKRISPLACEQRQLRFPCSRLGRRGRRGRRGAAGSQVGRRACVSERAGCECGGVSVWCVSVWCVYKRVCMCRCECVLQVVCTCERMCMRGASQCPGTPVPPGLGPRVALLPSAAPGPREGASPVPAQQGAWPWLCRGPGGPLCLGKLLCP